MPNPVQSDKPCLAVVAACIRNAQGEVLVAQRRENDAYGGLWEFPGGKVESNETEEQAIVRELKEELGVTAIAGRLLNIFEDENPYKKIKVAFYEARIRKGIPRALECARWKYADVKKEIDLDWAPVDKKIVGFLRVLPRVEEIIRRIDIEYIRHHQVPSVTKISEVSKQSAFHVLISCLISLRTKDEVTIAASERLFQKADNPHQLMGLSVQQIEKLIYPAGFYRKKAKLLRGIGRTLVVDYGGNVPDTLEGLIVLKGVGRKTANLVLGLAYGIPAICVDTHVHRICNRIGLISTRTPDQTEYALQRIIPVSHWIRLNTLLVFWGRSICKPVSPVCSRCPVSSLCRKISVRLSR